MRPRATLSGNSRLVRGEQIFCVAEKKHAFDGAARIVEPESSTHFVALPPQYQQATEQSRADTAAIGQVDTQIAFAAQRGDATGPDGLHVAIDNVAGYRHAKFIAVQKSFNSEGFSASEKISRYNNVYKAVSYTHLTLPTKRIV